MTSDVRTAIREAYPTGKSDAVSELAIATHRDLSAAAHIVEAIREVPGLQCEDWQPDDELDRALRLLVVTPSLDVWWHRFHGQALETRIRVIRDSGGSYCNLTVYISNLSDYWFRNWTCFRERPAGEVDAAYRSKPPNQFWADVDKSLRAIFDRYQRVLLTDEQTREEVDWIEPDRDPFERHPEKVTVYTCLFDYS